MGARPRECSYDDAGRLRGTDMQTTQLTTKRLPYLHDATLEGTD